MANKTTHQTYRLGKISDSSNVPHLAGTIKHPDWVTTVFVVVDIEVVVFDIHMDGAVHTTLSCRPRYPGLDAAPQTAVVHGVRMISQLVSKPFKRLFCRSSLLLSPQAVTVLCTKWEGILPRFADQPTIIAHYAVASTYAKKETFPKVALPHHKSADKN